MSDDASDTDDARRRAHEYPIVDDDGQRSNMEWVGFAAGDGQIRPTVYNPETETVYQGELDRDRETVQVDRSRRRDLGEDETLGDYLEQTGEDLGWTWLSEFAHDHLETTGHDAALDVVDWTFERRTVRAADDYDLAFFGSFTYRDDDGRVHTLEREFGVYTDPDRRAQTDQPVAVVDELVLSALPPNEGTRGGEAEPHDETRRELVVDVDPDAGQTAIEAFCEEWHESHPDPLGADPAEL